MINDLQFLGTHDDDDKLLHMKQSGLVPEKKEKTVINK